MSSQDNPFDRPERPESRLGLIADLAFVLCVAWLALWRSELSGAARGSVWASGWPVLVLAGLVAVALAVGLVQRRPRGFLPYALRWCFLAAILARISHHGKEFRPYFPS